MLAGKAGKKLDRAEGKLATFKEPRAILTRRMTEVNRSRAISRTEEKLATMKEAIATKRKGREREKRSVRMSEDEVGWIE